MPFRSMAQRRKFYALKAQGKMSQSMIDKWEEHTPDKKLPERLHKNAGDFTMSGFWSGFQKRAAEAVDKYVSADKSGEDYPGAPEKMLKWNDQGGVDPRAPEEMQAAQAAGLVTLPTEVDGASCGTCVHFRPITKKLGHGFCTNPEIKQDVTENMHCDLWEHPGSHDPAVAAQEAAQQQQVQQAQAAQQQQGMPLAGQAGQTPDMASYMMDQGLGQAGAGGAPPAQPQAGAGGAPPAQPMAGKQPPSAQAGAEVPEDSGGLPDDPKAKPSLIGSQSGFPGGPKTSGNPLVEQAVDDFQGQAATAGPTGGVGADSKPATKKPEKSNSSAKGKSSGKESGKTSDKSGKGHTINVNIGKDTEKKASVSNFWMGVIDDGY